MSLHFLLYLTNFNIFSFISILHYITFLHNRFVFTLTHLPFPFILPFSLKMLKHARFLLHNVSFKIRQLLLKMFPGKEKSDY